MAAVFGHNPGMLPPGQALVDLAFLIDLQAQLRRGLLGRFGDAQRRQLHKLEAEPSVTSWARRRFDDLPRRDISLAATLEPFRDLRGCVAAGTVTVEAAALVGPALKRVAPHLDRPDGLVDGQPGEQVVEAVVRNTVDLVSAGLLGLADGDPRLVALLARVDQIVGLPGASQLDRVEAAFTLLGELLPLGLLRHALLQQTDALVPAILEDEEARAAARKSLQLRPSPEGVAGQVRIDADAELWELLHTALADGARRDAATTEQHDALPYEEPQGPEFLDPHAASDSFAADPLSDEGERLAGVARPRTRGQRGHDALKLVLQRYLAAGLAGSHDKLPVTVTVTVTVTASASLVEGRPGSLPARGGSGQVVPTGLLRQWWCDASVTGIVFSTGMIPLGATHTQRTLTAVERRASGVQHAQACSGLRCCTPFDPLVQLVPHHLRAYAAHGLTSIAETIWACPTLHFDLHHGKTVQVRGGRWLNEQGWTTEPQHYPGRF